MRLKELSSKIELCINEINSLTEKKSHAAIKKICEKHNLDKKFIIKLGGWKYIK